MSIGANNDEAGASGGNFKLRHSYGAFDTPEARIP
ncbi:hypothetical protein ACVWYQ_003095 [Bradyrhizobium sp. USDA 3397]